MRIIPRCLVLAFMPFAAWAQSGDEDDARKDTNWQEAAHTLPARPDERNLLAFRVGSQPEGRFFVDPESISRGEDDVIRYVLVMRGSGGASTVTFEGVRCGVRARRLYASLERDGGWRAMKNSAWRDLPVQGSSIVMFGYSGNDPRAVLAYDYLCDGPAPRAREDIIARLRGKRIDYLDPGHGVEP